MQQDNLEGTWKSDKSMAQVYKELKSTLGMPQEQTSEVQGNETIMTNKKLDGGYWVTTMTVGDYKDEFKWKIDEEYETKTIIGGTTKATPKIEGDAIVEIHTLNVNNKELKLYVRTKVNGNVMTTEMECNGVKMTSTWNKMK